MAGENFLFQSQSDPSSTVSYLCLDLVNGGHVVHDGHDVGVHHGVPLAPGLLPDGHDRHLDRAGVVR